MPSRIVSSSSTTATRRAVFTLHTVPRRRRAPAAFVRPLFASRKPACGLRRAVLDCSTHDMRTSVTVRLIFMTVLALGLLIPLAWVWEIVAERATRRDAAASEIGATWGGAQYITGPVIAVPYTVARNVDAPGQPESAI